MLSVDGSDENFREDLGQVGELTSKEPRCQGCSQLTLFQHSVGFYHVKIRHPRKWKKGGGKSQKTRVCGVMQNAVVLETINTEIVQPCAQRDHEDFVLGKGDDRLRVVVVMVVQVIVPVVV